MTRKDIIFYSLVLLWIVAGFILIPLKCGDAIYIPQAVIMSILVILIVLKNTNTKFNIWIETEISDIKSKEKTKSDIREEKIKKIIC